MADVVKPYLTIRPGSGWAALNLAEVWQFRDLLLTLAARDIKVRYKQTLLGVVWVILQPLMGAGIFTFIFGKVLDVKTGNTPYFLVAYTSLLGWNVFNNILGKCSGCLVGNAHLISKVYFPRLILPLTSVPATLLDFGIAMLVLIIPLAHYRIVPGPGIFLLPIWMTILILMAMGIGLVTSALMVSYRDVGYVMPLLTQILFYASPVIYTAANVMKSENIRPWMKDLYFLNPIAPLLEAFRWSVVGEGECRPLYIAYAAALAALLFGAGMFAFKRMERKFADVV